jgi:hypothetical protein
MEVPENTEFSMLRIPERSKDVMDEQPLKASDFRAIRLPHETCEREVHPAKALDPREDALDMSADARDVHPAKAWLSMLSAEGIEAETKEVQFWKAMLPTEAASGRETVSRLEHDLKAEDPTEATLSMDTEVNAVPAKQLDGMAVTPPRSTDAREEHPLKQLEGMETTVSGNATETMPALDLNAFEPMPVTVYSLPW